MRFVSTGPEIPADLVMEQEKGRTVFVCGAGVSRTIGLPLFRGLVDGVYRKLGEDWQLHTAEREGMEPGGVLNGQYDRVLRCLERRLVGSDLRRNRGMRERIRAAVAEVLEIPNDADFSNHLALLELSRDAEGRIRVLTTNFDTAFERAWKAAHGTMIASHAGAAMPQPKATGFEGVLHLHGRLADTHSELLLPSTDLVLTSAEFGDAYLRSGWASRYVYDLVRAHTLVLVGYQADDPPMRYLLEALEADRERYPDLQKVYAFASCMAGNEKSTRELWRAKGVEPILYVANNEDHGLLYQILREWRRYAEDPTAWRREELRGVLKGLPSTVPEAEIQRTASLLKHGDASQLLGELSPDPAWLPVLIENRVFGPSGAKLGEWIVARIDDAAMIRACANLDTLDESTSWHLNRAVENKRDTLGPVRLKAWQLIESAKRRSARTDPGHSWFLSAKKIKRGQVDFEARRLVSNILRPSLTIKKPWAWPENEADSPEALHDLLNIEFESATHPSTSEILKVWPEILEGDVNLFRTLERAFLEALEEASDVGYMEGLDRASMDVPSVASHPQNAYHDGFYPITRVLADLWQRIAVRDFERARALITTLKEQPYLLSRRLGLFFLRDGGFRAEDVAAAIAKLDDKTFWVSDARVEIMHLVTTRWQVFSALDRDALEARLRKGLPRALFPDDAFENQEEWISILDSERFRRFKRIVATGGVLSTESLSVLRDIEKRHPQWKPSAGDRDDFHRWSESGRGPEGHAELLADIADEKLVTEAMRLQRERRHEEGDVWRVFCAADPDRALRGLRHDADNGGWNSQAWRTLLWESGDKGETEFHLDLGDLLLRMPEVALREFLPAACSWLQRRRTVLTKTDRPGGPRFLRLWDRFADLTYISTAPIELDQSRDILSRSLNEPGGILAWTLLDALSEPKPKAGAELGAELTPRFDRIAKAMGTPGLLGRVYLVRALSYFDAVDPEWTNTNLLPALFVGHAEFQTLWQSRAHGTIGSARLFNALKPHMLEHFQMQALSDHDFEGLVAQLLSVGIWHKQGNAKDYQLTAAEIKQALSIGPDSVRQHASWSFWHMMGEEDGQPKDRAERWRKVVGPLFREVWPLDASLRNEGISRNLVLMALESETAFPDAVDAILDVVIPYQLYSLSSSLRLDQEHNELVKQYPVAFLKLANGLIDPGLYPVPDDLAGLLADCVAAKRDVLNESSYIRLLGLRRLRGA